MKNKDIKFLNKYYYNFNKLINFDEVEIKKKLCVVKKHIIDTKKKEKKY